MLLSTTGIVLHTTPYSESSVVVKVFTRSLGVQSYIVKGVRKAKTRHKQNLLQPLTQLDMVVYHSDRTDLHYVKELSLHRSMLLLGSSNIPPLDSAIRVVEDPTTFDLQEASFAQEPPTTPLTNALRFFITEVLYRTLVASEPMPDLYDYVATLNLVADPTSLPIRFLICHAQYLGFAPMDDYTLAKPYFDLQQGCYVSEPDESTLSAQLSLLLHHYLAPYSYGTATPPLQLRQQLIDALLAYLRLHLACTGEFRSPDILHQLLV